MPRKGTKRNAAYNPWHNIRMPKVFLKSLIRPVTQSAKVDFFNHQITPARSGISVNNSFYL